LPFPSAAAKRAHRHCLPSRAGRVPPSACRRDQRHRNGCSALACHSKVTHDGVKTFDAPLHATAPVLGFAISPDGETVVASNDVDGTLRAQTGALAFEKVACTRAETRRVAASSSRAPTISASPSGASSISAGCAGPQSAARPRASARGAPRYGRPCSNSSVPARARPPKVPHRAAVPTVARGTGSGPAGGLGGQGMGGTRSGRERRRQSGRREQRRSGTAPHDAAPLRWL
jgi:hypothetical protein